MRTRVIGSVGIGALGRARSASGTSFSVTGAASRRGASALRSALMPPTTNIEESIGRASSREIVMPSFLHDSPATGVGRPP